MIDIEKVKKGLECCSNTGKGRCEKSECPYWTDSICCIDEMQSDALELLKEQEAVKPQDAEMLIIHNGGAEEYVKDIESIVLLAHKDYDIVYCGRFSEGR